MIVRLSKNDVVDTAKVVRVTLTTKTVVSSGTFCEMPTITLFVLGGGEVEIQNDPDTLRDRFAMIVQALEK